MTQNIKKPRRHRADSKEAAVADMLNAERVIRPPADYGLTAQEMVMFDELITELPKGEWTQHMIRMAAGLARSMADARNEEDAIRREGSVVIGASGGPIRNPRCAQLAALKAGIIAARRSLSLHSRGKAGLDNRALARRRTIQRENEAAPFDDDDGLIARPPLN
jgi:hypothetical protein